MSYFPPEAFTQKHRHKTPGHLAWCGLALWLALLILASPASAETPEAIEREIKQQQQQIGQTRAEREAAGKALAEVSAEIEAIAGRREDIDQKITRHAAAERNLLAEQDEINQAITRARRTIHQGLTLLYPLSRQGSARMLFAADSALLTRRHMHYVRALVVPIQENYLVLNEQQQRLAENRQELEKAREELDQAYASLQGEQRELIEQLHESERLHEKLGRALDSQQAELKRLLDRRERLEQAIAQRRAEQAEPTEPAEPKTRLDRAMAELGSIPVDGSQIRGFGERSSAGLRSNGVIFSAPAGSPIRAVADGKVAYAGALSGWGQIVMLRHARGFLSLYAHADRLAVETGSQVEQGAVIGHAGQLDGGDYGVYVEVRLGQNPINPTRWGAYREARR